MAKRRYKTETERATEMALYGEVKKLFYFVCEECSERSSVKTSDGKHYCIEHYLAKVDKEVEDDNN